MLAASPALGAGIAPPKPRELAEQCFDPEAVVLGAKPHRYLETTPRRGEGEAAAGQAPMASTDARPILTLVLQRPRDCETVLSWDSVYAPSPRPGLLDGEPGDGFDMPSHARLAAAAPGVGVGDMTPPPRMASLADPVSPESLQGGGFTILGGFALPPSPTHGLAQRASVGAAAPPNAGFSALAAPRGPVSPAGFSPDALSTPGDSPAGPTGPAAQGRIAGVPEPSTWSLLFLGVFMVGASLRRRPSTSVLKPV
jgi:PEP-CTERM motif